LKTTLLKILILNSFQDVLDLKSLNHKNRISMTTQEVANRLVELCRMGQFIEAIEELYHEDILSIEPEGNPIGTVSGIETVKQKTRQFNEMVEEHHGGEISDPMVAENFFSVSMKMDVTFKGAPRNVMEEICVYNVQDGKIVKEQFFFTPQPQA
jgi:hypothetical protein